MISYTTYWWWGEDLNLRRLSRQIYSLIPLTAREPLRKRGAIFITWRHPVNTFISKNRYLCVERAFAPESIQRTDPETRRIS